MIKAEVNKDAIHIAEMEGNTAQICSELCCLTYAVCRAWSEDEPFSEETKSTMIVAVANALILHDKLTRGADLEDDENASF